MRIAYYPAGTREFASSRLRVWKIVDALTALGHEVTVNGDPFKADTIVVQKRNDLNGIMHQARQKGIRVIYDVDDYMRDMVGTELADVTTVDTASKLELYPNAVIIPDALDVDIDSPRKTKHSEYLETVVWVGNTDNMYHVLYAAQACYNLGLKLTLITQLNHPRWSESFNKLQDLNITLFDWSLETVDEIMVQDDLAIFPLVFDEGGWSKEWVASKSANRLLKAWALGLPAAGTPIPSFVGAGLYNCAQTLEEWMAVLEKLQDYDQRTAAVEVNYLYAQEFRAERIVDQWLTVFQG